MTPGTGISDHQAIEWQALKRVRAIDPIFHVRKRTT